MKVKGRGQAPAWHPRWPRGPQGAGQRGASRQPQPGVQDRDGTTLRQDRSRECPGKLRAAGVGGSAGRVVGRLGPRPGTPAPSTGRPAPPPAGTPDPSRPGPRVPPPPLPSSGSRCRQSARLRRQPRIPGPGTGAQGTEPGVGRRGRGRGWGRDQNRAGPDRGRGEDGPGPPTAAARRAKPPVNERADAAAGARCAAGRQSEMNGPQRQEGRGPSPSRSRAGTLHPDGGALRAAGGGQAPCLRCGRGPALPLLQPRSPGQSWRGGHSLTFHRIFLCVS